MKQCNKCDVELDGGNCYPCRDGKARYTCKKCENKGRKLRQYKITEEEYDSLHSLHCYICGSDKRLVIDHCHASGNVRKKICYRCNVVLGLVGDSPSLLTNLKNYLEEHYDTSRSWHYITDKSM